MDQDLELDFEGFLLEDCHQIFLRTGETDVTVEDVENWLDDNDANPGYQVLSLGEIADSVVNESNSSSSESEEEVVVRSKMAEVRDSIDTLLKYVDVTANQKIQGYYHCLHTLRELTIRKQYQSGKQLKLDSFFKPTPVDHENEHHHHFFPPPTELPHRPYNPSQAPALLRRSLLASSNNCCEALLYDHGIIRPPLYDHSNRCTVMATNQGNRCTVTAITVRSRQH